MKEALSMIVDGNTSDIEQFMDEGDDGEDKDWVPQANLGDEESSSSEEEDGVNDLTNMEEGPGILK